MDDVLGLSNTLHFFTLEKRGDIRIVPAQIRHADLILVDAPENTSTSGVVVNRSGLAYPVGKFAFFCAEKIGSSLC